MNRILSVTPMISRTAIRRIATSETRQAKTKLERLKEKQMQFQVDNDVPIYLKGGVSDSVLYYTTVALVLGGVVMSLQAIYKLATHK